MLSFRLCAMTHQIRQRARYAIVDIVVVLAFSIRYSATVLRIHHLTSVLL